VDSQAWVADLVLEGGGVKGIGLVGAVSALHDKGYRFGTPGRVAGTSAGAIVGALVAAGMEVPRLVALMRDLDYARFRDGPPFGILGRGASLLTRLGMYRGDYLHRWIAEQLAGCGVRTFRDLKLDDPDSGLPPERAYKLVVLVSEVSTGRMLRLPWDYPKYDLDPDEQPVADAVRASASIPFYFRPHRLALKDGGAVWCTDGGMLSNFPVHVFDRYDRRPRWPTFGVKLSARPADGPRGADAPRLRGPIGFGRALVSTMMDAHDRLDMDDPSVCARTIFVETSGTNATDFGLPPEVRDELYRAGRAGATEFLTGWDFDDYLRRFRPAW
jgi:NTE family protein